MAEVILLPCTIPAEKKTYGPWHLGGGQTTGAAGHLNQRER